MHPGIANNTRKTDPDGRSSQMAGVGNQCVAIQPGREQLLAISYAVLLAHGVQPRRPPGLVQGFHDECRHAGLELIGMCLEPAMIGLHKGKGEGIKGFAGRSEEHTSELQSLMRISYAVFCLKKKQTQSYNTTC